MIRILLEAWPGEVCVAAVDTRDELFAGLLDFALWRPGDPDGLGDLHAGRIAARVPAMAGAFVALGGDAPDGFLPDSEGAKGLHDGDRAAVRITRSASGGKGPRLSARVPVADAEAVAAQAGTGLVRPGPNPVERVAALHKHADIVAGVPALLAALRPALGARVVVGHARFPDDVADAIKSLADPAVTVPNGCVLRFSPTPALVAIDVDSAAATGGPGASATIWNLDLMSALARQIRLRDLSGAILVDLAGLPARRRASLGDALHAALAPDPRRPRFLGFTELGLAEIVRTRAGPPLHERLGGPHAAALASLHAAVVSQVRSITVSPQVARALTEDSAARQQAEDSLGGPLGVRVDPRLPPASWRLAEA